MRLETAAATHRGRMRSRNEDAYFAGESTFAVADGMGGHLAGDVASATALLPFEGLDGRVFADAPSAQAALLDAILAANAAVVRKAAGEPTLYGMGTTLTAAIVEGRRLHVGHVGDSRAYLLRDGELLQVTRDHTLVARLIEEGQITEEEAAVHPQRSIITRAVGVDVDLEVDTMTVELQDGDQVLICSDGLTGPVDDETIADALRGGADVRGAVGGLIDLANAAGGPDNITVVLVRYHETDVAEAAASPAAAGTAAVIRSRPADTPADPDWARQLGRYGAGRRAGEEDRGEGDGVARRVLIWSVVGLILLALAGLGARWLLSRSFFVGTDEGRVAIYHGVPASLGPVELHWVAERTDVPVEDVASWYRPRLDDGIAAADLVDARRIVANAPRDDGASPDGVEPTPAPTATGP